MLNCITVVKEEQSVSLGEQIHSCACWHVRKLNHDVNISINDLCYSGLICISRENTTTKYYMAFWLL